MGRFYTLRNKASLSKEDGDNEKLFALIEYVVLIFLVTFIPALIRLGRPPVSLAEVWVELLVAILACVFGYARMRGIDLGGGD